jgi:hypothetical protein
MWRAMRRHRAKRRLIVQIEKGTSSACHRSNASRTGTSRARVHLAMKICECCGNEYDKCIDVTIDGETYTFDCFECAIQMLAPTCPHCDCRIIGHGVEVDGAIYCCGHCSRQQGAEGIVDNADHAEEERVPV